MIGSKVDLTYDYEYFGESAKALDDILNGSSEFAKVSLFYCFLKT